MSTIKRDIISRYDIDKIIKCITYNNDQRVVLSKINLGKELSEYDKSIISNDLNDYIKSGLSKEFSEKIINIKYKLATDE